jgi:hypothetical protein
MLMAPMTSHSKAFVVLLLLLALAGCDNGRAKVTALLQPELASDALQIWVSHRSIARTRVPPSEYPPSVKALHPKGVYGSPEGLYITTYAFFVEESGIFVRFDPSFDPPETGDPGFAQLAPNIYWFDAPG